MKSFYKFCYWLGIKVRSLKLESWAYLRWFSSAVSESNSFSFFEFSKDYFKFCEKWGIKNSFGK